MDGTHNHGRDPADGYTYTDTDRSYAFSGKIMLTAIIVLFFVVILMFSLHLYARWYLLQARRRHLQNRRRHLQNRRVFYIDPSSPASHRGLDPDLLKTLPVFAFSSPTHPDPNLECAVCLSQFEDKETGRTLPKCNHSFHIDCIDMWFHSHSTCPLCRTPVDWPVDPGQHVVLNVTDPRPAESELCSSCLHGEDEREPPPKLSIEVPGRSGQAVDGEGCQSLRSPVSRILSLRRMMLRQSPVPSPRIYGPVRESETERVVPGDEVNGLGQAV